MNRFFLWALIIGVFAGHFRSASAQEAPSGTVTSVPQIIEEVPAEYPASAQQAGVSGDVVLEIDISEKGEVTNAQVVSSPGYGLSEAALAAAKQLRFTPAQIDHQPAAVRIEYRFHFAIKPVAPEPDAALQTTAGPASAPAINLRGKIVERGSKEPLTGAMIDINEGALTAYSDDHGYFEVTGVPTGKAKIVVLESSHHRFETEETIVENKVTEVTYYLRRSVQGAFETVVVGQKEKKEVSTVTISSGEVRRIPGVSGDMVKVVQNLPGAARTPFGSGSLVLRGGNPTDTKVYIDGIEIPIVFHFFGITSVYSSELSKDVEYEPGNFGAHYGRATAGRVEIITRDPNPKQLRLLADTNVLHTTLMAEGPLNNNWSVAASVRRSYVDVVLNSVLDASQSDGSFSVAPRYYDYQSKLLWTPNKSDSVRLSFYGSDDRLALVGLKERASGSFDSLDLKTRFVRGVLSWDHKKTSDTRFKLVLAQGYDNVVFYADSYMRDEEVLWTTTVRAEGYRDYGNRLTLGVGFDGQFHRYSANVKVPPITRANEMPNPLDQKQSSIVLDQTYRNWSPAAWVEATYRPIDNLSLVPGVRLDYASYIHSTWFDPRLVARWDITPKTTLKGGAGIYHRFPFPPYLSQEFGNPDLGPEGSRQYSLGMEKKIFGPLTADIQVYYKSLYNLVEPSSNVVVRNGQSVSERYRNSGTGSAYGAELLVRYNADGRFFGWLAYAYSRTTRDENNIGGRLDATGDQYDQPHNLTAVGTLELPEIWQGLSAGFRLRFGSGNPYRKTIQGIYDVDAGGYDRIPSTDRDQRLPDFFQVDLRVDKKWTFQLWSFSAYLEVLNVTNRENPRSVNYNFDYSKYNYLADFPMCVIPSFGLRFEY